MADDLRDYLAALPGAELEAVDVAEDQVFEWGSALSRTQVRTNAHKILIGRALKANRTALPHGEAAEWFEGMADRLGRTRRTLSTWMRVANAVQVASEVADQIGRKLPVSILDRRFDEIPAALSDALGEEGEDSVKRSRVPSLKACIGLMQTRVEASVGNIEELRQLEAALLGMLNQVRESAAGLDEPEHAVDLTLVREPEPLTGREEATSGRGSRRRPLPGRGLRDPDR